MTPASITTDALDAQTSPITDSRPNWSRRVSADLVAILDAAAVIAGSAAPALIYGSAGGVTNDWRLVFQAAAAAAIITHLLLRYWNMYDTSKMHNFPQSPVALLAALALGLFGTIGLAVPQPVRAGHEWIWFLTWLSASYTLLVMNRGIINTLFAHFTAAGRFDERVAVFGAGSIARRVHDHLKNKTLGISFAGVFDDRMGQDRVNPEGLAVSGRLDDLVAAARNGQIDKIIIALPQSADNRISAIACKLEHLPVSVQVVTHMSSDILDKAVSHKVSSLGPVGMIDVKMKALSDWGLHIKRAEDVILGTLLLVLSAPLFPLIALAIKAQSNGPVLFRQRRRGFNQSVIEIYKFRTMVVLEDGDDVRQATSTDERVTRIGRILRRTSLDELPQLWNVLKGEMSLVGPRPHALAHDDKFAEMLNHYADRHQVKPGLTGLAQIRGFRGETATSMSIQARVNADIAYIKNWSLGLDLRILMLTLWAVIKARNAH